MTRTVYTFLAAALVAGCASPLPLVVRDGGTVGAPMDDLPDVVAEACAVLGVVCIAAATERGAVVVDLVHTTDRVRGRHGGTWCEPWVWVDPTPERVAHELGHVLGLGHVDDAPDNVMGPTADGFDLTDEQLDTVEDRAGLLIACG